MTQKYPYGTQVRIVKCLKHWGGTVGEVVDLSKIEPGCHVFENTCIQTPEGKLIAISDVWLEEIKAPADRTKARDPGTPDPNAESTAPRRLDPSRTPTS